MRIWLEQKGLDISGYDGRSDEIIKLIRKLRWIGMEEEAARVQSEWILYGVQGVNSMTPALLLGRVFQ
jgi:hypothetical protein